MWVGKSCREPGYVPVSGVEVSWLVESGDSSLTGVGVYVGVSEGTGVNVGVSAALCTSGVDVGVEVSVGVGVTVAASSDTTINTKTDCPKASPLSVDSRQ